MAKVKIKVTRENKGSVSRSFVLIDNRVLLFENGDDTNILVEAGTKHGITVVCIGDIHASTTAKVTRASGNVINPLEVTIDPEDNGIDHSSDEFEVKAV